ncbi:MAG: YkgJ family cysteine cluster protein [Acidobacteriota bacterium]
MAEPVQITRLKKSEFYGIVGNLEELKESRILPSQLPLHELSRIADQRIVTDPSAPVPDCLTCGVCCNFALMVTVTPSESAPLKEYWDVILEGVEDREITINRVLPRSFETGSCSFLEGNLRENIYCGIYENRPHACRDFDAGSDKCHAYRRMYGVEPPLTADQVTAALAKFKVKPPPQKISFVGIVKSSESRIVDENDVPDAGGITLRIVAFLDEDGVTEHDLHTYDPSKETWFENEFLSLSLGQAKELIAARTGKA